MIKIHAGETEDKVSARVSTSGVNESSPPGGVEIVANGAFGCFSFPSNVPQKLISCSSDDSRALNEIQLAFSNILSNLGKLVPVERQHVALPAIAT